MILIKCGYSYCKLGGEVEKENAVKKSNRYWHKECVHESEVKNEIKETYYRIFKSKEPSRNVVTAIKKFVNDQGYDADYVLFCLKYKAQKLNSIYGLSYTLSYKANEDEYKKKIAQQTKIVFEKPKNDFFEKEIKKINKKNDKKWGDFF